MMIVVRCLALVVVVVGVAEQHHLLTANAAFVQVPVVTSTSTRSTTTTTTTTTTAMWTKARQQTEQLEGDENYNDYDESRRTAIIGGMAGILSFLPAVTVQALESKSLSEEYRQGTAALADMDEAAPVPKEAYKKLPSGVIIADLRPGRGGGETVKEGSVVNLQWVLRKSNGYFVDSSEVSGGVPFIFKVGDGRSAIAGIDEGVRGMTAGSVRRILIPPSLAYVDGVEDGKPGPLPQGFGPRQQIRRVQTVRKDVPGEYIFLEVQVTRIR